MPQESGSRSLQFVFLAIAVGSIAIAGFLFFQAWRSDSFGMQKSAPQLTDEQKLQTLKNLNDTEKPRTNAELDAQLKILHSLTRSSAAEAPVQKASSPNDESQDPAKLKILQSLNSQ